MVHDLKSFLGADAIKDYANFGVKGKNLKILGTSFKDVLSFIVRMNYRGNHTGKKSKSIECETPRAIVRINIVTA